MSLSKLNPTSGSSSVSDGQNPLSEKQHPLLLPTVLDNIFQYLTFAEVKSNRLVCKAWAEVGIPFIGRRKLEPVNFSDVSHKDFFALKQEFEDPSVPHPKLKLFQGFRLTWEDVVTKAVCYFMPSFKPKQLYISGDVINYPSVSLRNLLQPIVATLRDLTIKIKWPSSVLPSFLILRNLAGLGMTLHRLHLQIINKRPDPSFHLRNIHNIGDISIVRGNLNTLLENQAPFLEELSLKFDCYIGGRNDDKVLMNKIQFPIFPRLQSLTLALELNIDLGRFQDNFQPFDFCVKFPNLLHLDILLDFYEIYVGDIFDSTKGHSLKKLNINSSNDPYTQWNFPIQGLNKLGVSFPLLEEFTIQGFGMGDGVDIPWVDTLRKLEVCGSSLEFNFLHLKELEYLHYTIREVIPFITINALIQVNVNGLINRLLDHYTQLPHLNKFRLSGLKVSPEQMILIQEGLPAEFRAILTFD